MLSTKSWTNQIFQNCTEVRGCVAIPFSVGQWLFVSCIIFSFLLVRNIPVIVNLLNLTCFPVKLAYEGRKTKRIIASRDISYAFTNVMANNYYSLRKNSCLVIKCTY
jgi:hypothetical protein